MHGISVHAPDTLRAARRVRCSSSSYCRSSSSSSSSARFSTSQITAYTRHSQLAVSLACSMPSAGPAPGSPSWTPRPARACTRPALPPTAPPARPDRTHSHTARPLAEPLEGASGPHRGPHPARTRDLSERRPLHPPQAGASRRPLRVLRGPNRRIGPKGRGPGVPYASQGTRTRARGGRGVPRQPAPPMRRVWIEPAPRQSSARAHAPHAYPTVPSAHQTGRAAPATMAGRFASITGWWYPATSGFIGYCRSCRCEGPTQHPVTLVAGHPGPSRRTSIRPNGAATGASHAAQRPLTSLTRVTRGYLASETCRPGPRPPRASSASAAPPGPGCIHLALRASSGAGGPCRRGLVHRARVLNRGTPGPGRPGAGTQDGAHSLTALIRGTKGTQDGGTASDTAAGTPSVPSSAAGAQRA